MSEYSVFLRVRVRRPSGQDRGPDLRTRCWTPSSPGQVRSRGMLKPKTGVAIIAGEVTLRLVDLEELVRKVIIDIGYDSSDVGFVGGYLRRAEHHRQAVGGHQPGRRPGQAGRPGRRRPGA